MVDLMEREEVHTGFWWGNVRQRDNLQDLGVYGNIILKLIVKKLDWGMEWIYLGRWGVLVNEVKNLRVLKYVEDFLTS